MALFVVPIGLREILGEKLVRSSAGTVKDLLEEIRGRVGEAVWQKYARAYVLVNGVAASRLGGKKAPLRPDDEVWLVFPAGGG